MNRLVRCPIQGAVHGVNAVRTIDRRPCCFRHHEVHGHVDAANDEHAILRFHLSGYIRGQFSVAGIDLARFQRANQRSPK